MIARTPDPPYYAVIFTSVRTDTEDGYASMAGLMVELAARQPGYLGVEHAGERLGITISYWADEESIRAWKANAEHQLAQKYGREKWYASFALRVAKVERASRFDRS